VPRTQSKYSNLTRRQKTLIWDWLVPISLMMFIVGCATLVTYLVVEPLLHPHLHPRLVKWGTYLVHYHPRLCRYFPIAIVSASILLQIIATFLPVFRRYWVRKRGIRTAADLKIGRYLNQKMEQTIALLLPEAWQVVRLALPGLYVTVPDIRSSHWEVLEINEVRREMRLSLRYFHDPLGIKIWRLYPRQILCHVKLRAKGVRTNIELTYTADSAMDYPTVYNIIDKTNENIKAAMEAERAVRC